MPPEEQPGGSLPSPEHRQAFPCQVEATHKAQEARRTPDPNPVTQAPMLPDSKRDLDDKEVEAREGENKRESLGCPGLLI